MADFTPGPWRVCETHEAEIVGRPSWPCRRHGVEGEWRVATTDEMDGDAAEQEANARLIAAAPDLLEVLREMVRWNVKRGGANDEPLSADQQDPEVAQAMAAIAKAEGR